MRFPQELSSLILIAILCTAHVHGGGFLEMCTSNSDCGAGLYCASCVVGGAMIPRCIRNEATALTNITSLPFNKVSWLVTHNSYAIVGFPEETGPRLTFTNQEDNVTYQLNNGVRGLMLDTYDFQNDVWLCHSFGGECYVETAFGPLLNTLNEVQVFLAANPSEIVTIILEDYVTAPNGLTNVFKAADLMQYWFPVASMPINGADWPTIGTMILKNWRLLVFTSISSKQATEGIAYQWGFMNENQYGDVGMQPGNCTNRAESKPLNNMGVSLVLQNFFRTDPMEAASCEDNSKNLYNQLPYCYTAFGNRWANFLAVDFYKQSTGGGSFQAVDKLNGQTQCGCNSPLSCQSQKSPGKCADDPSLLEFSPSFLASSPVPSPQAAVPSPQLGVTGTKDKTIYQTRNGSVPAAAPSSTSSLLARTSVALLVILSLISSAALSPL